MLLRLYNSKKRAMKNYENTLKIKITYTTITTTN